MEKKKKQRKFSEICILLTCISQMAKVISFKFKTWCPLCREQLHHKFGAIQEGITELRLHENCDFVLPVNMLTSFVHPVFLGCTTHYHAS